MNNPDVAGEDRLKRLDALANAYEPGEYALADGVCHVYYHVPNCCQTLRDDLRALCAIARRAGDVLALSVVLKGEQWGSASEIHRAEQIKAFLLNGDDHGG